MSVKSNKKSKVGSVIGTIVYVLLLLVLIFTLIMNISRKENQISSVFGYSFAVVQSGSMKDGGFNVGDMVIIKNTDTDNLRKGDIVVFYQYYDDPYDQSVKNSLVNITDLVDTPDYTEVDKDKSILNLRTKEDAMQSKKILVFHRIVNIFVDPNGIRFFETKGDSNNSADKYIREDFVCAKYVGTSPFLQSVLNFTSSTVGMVVVIIVPVAITMFLECFVFRNELKGNILAGRLLERKIRLKDIDTEKVKLAEYLSEPEKIYLYDITPKEDKENMGIVLFEESVYEILHLCELDRGTYYDEFAKKLQPKDIKKLLDLKLKADIIVSNPDIPEDEANKKVKEILRQNQQK